MSTFTAQQCQTCRIVGNSVSKKREAGVTCTLSSVDKKSKKISIASSFVDRTFNCSTSTVQNPSSAVKRSIAVRAGAVIQFIRGIDEQTVPDVKLTRSVNGLNGTAVFVFDQPSVFDNSKELGDITGLYLIDDEGIIQSIDVSAKFVNGKPAKIEARHIMRSPEEWDRFMRFMEKYAADNDLGFVKK